MLVRIIMNKRELSIKSGLGETGWYFLDVTVEMQSSSQDYHILGRPGTVEVQRLSYVSMTEEGLSVLVTRGLGEILELLSDQDFYLYDPDMTVQGTPWFHASSLLRGEWDNVSAKDKIDDLAWRLWTVYGGSTVENLLALTGGWKHYGREVSVLSGETK
jgi:hypothetical protein